MALVKAWIIAYLSFSALWIWAWYARRATVSIPALLLVLLFLLPLSGGVKIVVLLVGAGSGVFGLIFPGM